MGRRIASLTQLLDQALPREGDQAFAATFVSPPDLFVGNILHRFPSLFVWEELAPIGGEVAG